MKNTYSVTEAQAKLPGLLREAVDGPIAISRHDATVAYIISKERMEAIAETLEILANPAALREVERARLGKGPYQAMSAIDAR